MKNHTKVYLKEMGYDTTDFIPCEVCSQKATDIHHIKARGMGGSKTADIIENLMALCRSCHMQYGDIKIYYDTLIDTHEKHLQRRGAK